MKKACALAQAFEFLVVENRHRKNEYLKAISAFWEGLKPSRASEGAFCISTTPSHIPP